MHQLIETEQIEPVSSGNIFAGRAAQGENNGRPSNCVKKRVFPNELFHERTIITKKPSACRHTEGFLKDTKNY